jgi:methylisocitrate lyase
MNKLSPGAQFRQYQQQESPLQVVGAINAYSALLASKAGFKALYLSGAGVANACYGLPDLALTSLTEVVNEASRITAISDLPLLVDIDTGWGGPLMIGRTIKAMERVGVAAVHLEDQVEQKRCGHRPNKQLVSPQAMSDRIKAAVDARIDPDFVLMARTDALASEGLAAMLERAQQYVAAGADMLFAEAVTELSQLEAISQALSVPVLANMTEFGRTPYFSLQQFRQAGVGLVLYPLTAFRAMNKAAWQVYQSIRQQGDQQQVLGLLETREQLYTHLNYQAYEQQLDSLNAQGE